MHTLSSSTLFVQVRQLTLDLLLIPRVTRGKRAGGERRKAGRGKRQRWRKEGWGCQTSFPITDEVHCVFDTPFQFSLIHLSYSCARCIFSNYHWSWLHFFTPQSTFDDYFFDSFTSSLPVALCHHQIIGRSTFASSFLLIHFNRQSCRRLWICYQCYKLSPLSITNTLTFTAPPSAGVHLFVLHPSFLISLDQISFTRASSVLELFQFIEPFSFCEKINK